MDRKLQKATLATGLFGAGLVVGLAVSHRSLLGLYVQQLDILKPLRPELLADGQDSQPADLPSPAAAFLSSANFVTGIAETVGPAVVRIDSSPDQASDQELRDPFQPPPSSDPGEPRQYGSGSGFIVSPEGTILTNAHVVRGSETVAVVLQDGRIFTGTVQGVDPVTDVAVVVIDGTDLPTVGLGDSDQVKPGAWAIAIGNPLGLDSSITAGIISAVGRSSGEVGAPNKRVAFLQTDAAINPGNSGGPLLNASGQVIGINTAIFERAQGVGFAIPINRVQAIADQLIATGRVEHAFLGIRMLTLTPELQQRINQDPSADFALELDSGVLIAAVVSDSPAEVAGLQSGDVITQIGSVAISSAEQVQQQVEAAGVGNTIQLRVYRQDQEQLVEVLTGTIPPESS